MCIQEEMRKTRYNRIDIRVKEKRDFSKFFELFLFFKNFAKFLPTTWDVCIHLEKDSLVQ